MSMMEWAPPAEGSNPLWFPINSPQLTALHSKAQILLAGGASGGGKGLWIETLIPTPLGFKRMGNLRVGDTVFGADGKPCLVTHVSDIHYRQCFEVNFEDGSMLIADDEHKWLTMSYAERRNCEKRTEEYRAKRRAKRPSRAKANSLKPGTSASTIAMNKARVYEYLQPTRGSVRNTAEIFDTLRTKGRQHLNHAVALARAIDLPEQTLAVDPYTLGLWLGDGNSARPYLGMMAEDLDHIVPKIPHVIQWRKPEKGYRRPFDTVRIDISLALKSYGLIKNKHIPSVYMRSSIEQRRELLRGILDTDGHCDSRGMIEIGLSAPRLASDVVELLWSLGIKATISVHKIRTPNSRDSLRMKFVADFPAFHLPRKRERQKTGNFRDTTQRRYITSVVPTLCVPTRCIAVDSVDHLYLAGKEMIPTHNTDLLVGDACQEYDNPNLRGILIRKSLQEMQQIQDRCRAIYGNMGGWWRDRENSWVFPSGARIRLGYMANDNSIERYIGNPFTWLGIDESTLLPEQQFRRILPWLASTDPSLFPRARLTTNPGNIGSAWHMHTFLRNKCPVHFPKESVEPGAIYRGSPPADWKEGQPLRCATWLSDGKPISKTVSFIPAKVEDNPLYGQDKVDSLKSQNEEVAAKLLVGCWCALEGMFFRFINDSYKLPLSEIPEEPWFEHFLGMDYGMMGSAAACGLYYQTPPMIGYPQGRIVKAGEVIERNMGSQDYARLVVETLILRQIKGQRCRLEICYADHAMDAHTGTGQSNLEMIAEVFSPYGVSVRKAAKDRIGSAQKLYAKAKDRSFVVSEACPKTFTSLRTRMHDPKMPGAVKKVDGEDLDDLYDETSYAINTHLAETIKPVEVQVAEKVEALREQGLDDRSLAIYNYQYRQELMQGQRAPVMGGRRTSRFGRR